MGPDPRIPESLLTLGIGSLELLGVTCSAKCLYHDGAWGWALGLQQNDRGRNAQS